ncbi:Peptidoglycan-N-acetylmuramic acid deacetylase PdaA [Alphaproteobacteria bacterium SO-S41]|nr:Peptidoglycan-N-acetylmuramic acid deacetylase PdaA [Alphaproteobacteria bacterium SO-S41]
MALSRFSFALLAAGAFAGAASAEIVTRMPTDEKVVALTFDACEAGKVAHLDHGVADWLIARKVPFTVFMGGRFARDNAADVKMLSALPFVEIENHSWSHRDDMRKLSDAGVIYEVVRAAWQVGIMTGRRTQFFRFPGGNTNAHTTALVEALGYKIVHWRWPEGDPDKHVSAKGMIRQTLAMTKPGEVLIFHINGRGVHTAEAIPDVVEGLEKLGYRFVLLHDYLTEKPDAPVAMRPTASVP